MRKTLQIAAFWLAIVAGSASAQERVEIIQLRHRLAQDVLPVVQQLMAPGGSASSMDNKLILRGSPAAIARVRETLAALDTPQRRLLITVRQGAVSESERTQAGVQGGIVVRNGDVDVVGRGGIEARAGNSRRNDEQQVQTVDGGEATIFIGQAAPVPTTQVVRRPDGSIVTTRSTGFVEAATGFAVRPQLSGEMVNVAIAPQSQRFNAQGVESSRVMTTVRGRLGEWLRLGGVQGETQRNERGLLDYSASSGSSSGEVWLKVEALE